VNTSDTKSKGDTMKEAIWTNKPVSPEVDDEGNDNWRLVAAILRCPECGNEGEEMAAFSYLAEGFNGIEDGDPDDLDCLECGKCSAKLEFPEGL
jgi:hypothetical protein